MIACDCRPADRVRTIVIEPTVEPTPLRLRDADGRRVRQLYDLLVDD